LLAAPAVNELTERRSDNAAMWPACHTF